MTATITYTDGLTLPVLTQRGAVTVRMICRPHLSR
jgi:hypothetical protein